MILSDGRSQPATAAPGVSVLRSAVRRLRGFGAAALDRLFPGQRVRSAFRAQASHCERMGSPFTALLCRLAARRLDGRTAVGAALLAWRGHPANDALPLRFAGALNWLVLAGRAPQLAALYPPRALPEPDRLWQAVLRTMEGGTATISAILRSPPQTNEVGRSGALLGGFLAVAAETRKPLFLSELGSSAGLNLFWDRFGYDLGGVRWGDPDAAVQLAPRWTGPLPPLDAPVRVAGRAGCDLAHVSVTTESDRLRLLAYVWPDQPERIARLRAALAIAAAEPPAVTDADAADWLEERLPAQPEGTAHIVFHTIVWQYLPAATKARIEAVMEAAGAAATGGRPLAWLRLEADGREPGGALTLTSWPQGRTRLLARADYHGRWVDWAG